jgi:hypothetical protein
MMDRNRRLLVGGRVTLSGYRLLPLSSFLRVVIVFKVHGWDSVTFLPSTSPNIYLQLMFYFMACYFSCFMYGFVTLVVVKMCEINGNMHYVLYVYLVISPVHGHHQVHHPLSDIHPSIL